MYFKCFANKNTLYTEYYQIFEFHPTLKKIFYYDENR